MTTYLDASTLLKLYVDEVDSEVARRLVSSDHVLVTSWVSAVEVRRNLARVLDGDAQRAAIRAFEADLDGLALVAAGEQVCRAAAQIGEVLGVRSLDAVHLATAQVLQIPGIPFATFDLRQAQAARSLGFTVLGT